MQEGYSKSLSKRLHSKRCLWLLRRSKNDISKMHVVDLCGLFSAQGANLDIIELAAVYWWLPSTFLNDDSGRKEQYRKAIEMNLKEMYRDKENGNLVGAKLRNAVYRNVSPLHGHRESMYVDIRSSIVNTFSSAWSKGGISDEGNAWEDVEDQESSRASSSSRGSNSTGTMKL